MEGLGKFEKQKFDKMPVPKEKLSDLGIPQKISMTQKELERHLQTKKLQSVNEYRQSKNAYKSLGTKMSRELTEEQIKRAEQAGQKREEMGR